MRSGLRTNDQISNGLLEFLLFVAFAYPNVSRPLLPPQNLFRQTFGPRPVEAADDKFITKGEEMANVAIGAELGTEPPEELRPAGGEQLDEHLLLCADCFSEWQSLQMVDGLFSKSPLVLAPAGFSERVETRVGVPSWSRALSALFALSAGSLIALLAIAGPAAAVLLGIWTIYNDPVGFSKILVWLNQLAGVSGSLLGSLWTALRLFFVEFAASPVTLIWSAGAALVLALWTHLLRRPSPAPVRNGFGQ